MNSIQFSIAFTSACVAVIGGLIAVGSIMGNGFTTAGVVLSIIGIAIAYIGLAGVEKVVV